MARIPSILALSLACLSGPARAQDAPAVGDALRRLGVTKGIVAVLGAPDARFPIDLAKSGELLVYVQVGHDAQAEALREAADRAGLLGAKLYVEKGSPSRIHLAENVADGVVITGQAERAEVLRVLRPGGRAIRGKDELVKPPPDGVDEWSHPYRGPDNNPQSADTRAKGPFLTQFMGEPWYSAMHHFSVFSGGRIFKIFGNRTSTQAHWASLNTLLALNAWNGTILWSRKLPEHFMTHRSTIVATPEILYFADDVSCKLLDAATGELRGEIVAPAELSDGPVWKWLALEDGVLYALVGEKEPEVQNVKGSRFRGAGWPWWNIDDYRFGFGRTLLAIDAKTKRILWSHREEDPIDSRALCMAAGRIFVYSQNKFVGALDRKTGKVLWKNSTREALDAIGKPDPAQIWWKGFATTSFAKCSDKALYFAGPTQTRTAAFSAEDGRVLWSRDVGNYQLVIRPEALYALGNPRSTPEGKPQSYKLDLLTGEVLAGFGARVSCTRATANGDSIFVRGGRGGSTTVYDVRSATPKPGLISPMRPACQDGVIVANGNLYWGPWICRCDTTQVGVISLSPAGDFDFAAEAGADRLEAAAGAPAPAGAEAVERDWPTYRKDNARSGVTPVAVAGDVDVAWTYVPSTANVATAPVAAGGSVYVAGSDGTVRGLDAATGRLNWQSHTGGWVKFSPTYAKGRLYAGSGDGWIYCLDAATGKRQWRFRAAPEERKIPVYGSLLSTWPVGSGVLVHDGVAYAAAGMANYDGTHAYALDAETGKIRWQNHASGHLHQERPDSGAGVQGHLLLRDGFLYMSAGSLTAVAKYALKDGAFSAAGEAVRTSLLGKDLYFIDGKVHTTGYPLYWRQMDSHHLTTYRAPEEGGALAVFDDVVGKLDPKQPAPAAPQGDRGGQPPKFLWSKKLFNEYASFARAPNAILLAGTNWQGEGPEAKASGGIAALDAAGNVLWKRDLPAPPVMFGAIVDGAGRILVALQDGRVVCLKGR